MVVFPKLVSTVGHSGKAAPEDDLRTRWNARRHIAGRTWPKCSDTPSVRFRNGKVAQLRLPETLPSSWLASVQSLTRLETLPNAIEPLQSKTLQLAALFAFVKTSVDRRRGCYHTHSEPAARSIIIVFCGSTAGPVASVPSCRFGVNISYSLAAC